MARDARLLGTERIIAVRRGGRYALPVSQPESLGVRDERGNGALASGYIAEGGVVFTVWKTSSGRIGATTP